MRGLQLYKPPGVAETIDWATSLGTLGAAELDEATVERHARDRREVPRGPGAGPPARRRRSGEAGLRTSPPPRLTGRRSRRRAVEPIAVAFARVLRGAGLAVPIGSVLTFAEALAGSGSAGREPVYWAARATLVRRPEDLPALRPGVRGLLGAAHAAASGRTPDGRCCTSRSPSTTATMTRRTSRTKPSRPDDDPTITLRFSATEVLRHKDFAAYSPDELQQAHELMADLRLAGTPRRSRRLVKTARPRRRQAGPICAARSELRCASGGEPIRRECREPGDRLRRLVAAARRLGLDGAVRPGAAALRAGRRRRPPTGRGVRARHPADPIDPGAAARTTPTWPWPRPASACRTGAAAPVSAQCLRRFNDEWGVRGMARGAIVVILSDGWDRGEPEELADADAAPPACRPPGRVGQPAQGHTRATRRWRGEWRRPCPMLTTSWKATRWLRWKSWHG